MVFKRYFLIILIITCVFLLLPSQTGKSEEQKSPKKIVKPEKKTEIKSVLHDVPFAPQAPYGEWGDPRQQDGCEEAAALMGVRFARNQALTLAQAHAEIINISAYESEKFGEFRDTSAADTATRIIKGYFGYTNIFVRRIMSANDIISEIMKGNVVIVPVNGQEINNPFFTLPGPERHMLLIRGYEMETNQFLTNDPGIYQGENYRYPTEVLYAAIRDYSSGYHVPIADMKKTMIVIEKS